VDNWNIEKRAADVHADALVWDNIFPFFDFYFFSQTMLGAQASQFDPKYRTLEEYRANGADFVGLTIAGSRSNVSESMRIIANNLSFLRAHPKRYKLVRTAEDVLANKSDGRLSVGFNFQGSDSLEGNLDMCEVYFELGVRQMLLCYNVRNAAGSGCHETTDDGLSEFGKGLVRRMNDLGMVVDASHTGRKTTIDILEISCAPVVFSHSNPAALQPHPRNIDDTQIRLCAETGGVIGVVGFNGFLAGRRATVAALLDAIDYIVQLVGPDHVGLGLDWIYCEEMFRQALSANTSAYPSGKNDDYATPAEFLGPSALPQITAGLMARGYDDTAVRKILGLNWLRIARAVWK
jgi:membrane dipeptidase